MRLKLMVLVVALLGGIIVNACVAKDDVPTNILKETAQQNAEKYLQTCGVDTTEMTFQFGKEIKQIKLPNSTVSVSCLEVIFTPRKSMLGGGYRVFVNSSTGIVVKTIGIR